MLRGAILLSNWWMRNKIYDDWAKASMRANYLRLILSYIRHDRLECSWLTNCLIQIVFVTYLRFDDNFNKMPGGDSRYELVWHYANFDFSSGTSVSTICSIAQRNFLTARTLNVITIEALVIFDNLVQHQVDIWTSRRQAHSSVGNFTRYMVKAISE